MLILELLTMYVKVMKSYHALILLFDKSVTIFLKYNLFLLNAKVLTTKHPKVYNLKKIAMSKGI